MENEITEYSSFTDMIIVKCQHNYCTYVYHVKKKMREQKTSAINSGLTHLDVIEAYHRTKKMF